MKTAQYILLIIVVATASIWGTYLTMKQEVVPTSVQQEPIDPYTYDGWKTITAGGVVEFKIPNECNTDSGAGTMYIVCPIPGIESPTPDMSISSDGIQVNVRRYENLDPPYWDKLVASLKVITPLSQSITISIDK